MLFDYLIAIVSVKAAEIGMSEVAKKLGTSAPPALRAGGLGVFAFHDVPSRRFAPSFVCFEVTTCIRWN